MKRNRLAPIILSLFLVFWFSGIAMGGGAEPGAGVPPQGNYDDCDCIAGLVFDGGPEAVQIPQLKGPYLKGTFTISYAPDATPGEANTYVTHIFLRWGNRIWVQPFYNISDGPICSLTDEVLKNLELASQNFCYRQVEEYFGLVGTPFVKELVITDRGGCGTSTVLNDDIIRGEITISVAPFTCPPTE